MTKTSTTPLTTTCSSSPVLETNDPEAGHQDEQFYQQLKPRLDQLLRDPSDETIASILAYNKRK